MGTIEEGFCRDDVDCSEKQYCYHVSGQCVNYTLCSRYNRAENIKPARSASQCGPCLPNYNAEELGTGEFSHLCKKINAPENVSGDGNGNTIWIVCTSIGVVAVIILIVIGCVIFFKRRGRKCKIDKSEFCDGICVMQPTAPPVESSPFIDHPKNLSYTPFNNNKILKDKNRLVNASVFKHPSWVSCDPNYENNLNNNHDSTNTLEQFNTTFERPSANDNPNVLVPAQLTEGQTDRNVTEFGREQVENSANAALVQRNNSNVTGDDTANNNNSENNNGNGSTSGSNNTRDGRERARSSNILIAQINVNVLNHD
ncbi:uncharacterized protein LOC143357003 [Halictus rubicundus]|uniref:uncharacterized protein LOC143357003 n=1 Tax=Halictus rubicundus TaxID=77578 RepID=UPI004035797F